MSIPIPNILRDATRSLNGDDHSTIRRKTWESYIEYIMERLVQYNAQRPAGHPYPFHEHSRRVAVLMKNFALHLGWDAENAQTLYWATLPHDIGKTALPVEIWDKEDKPSDEEKAKRRTHVQEGLNLIKREFDQAELEKPFTRLLLIIMENHHEALDGSGLFGKHDDQIDLISRMSCICDSFDGWSVERPHFGDRDISIKSVLNRMKVEKSGQFDSELLKQFEKMLSVAYDENENFVAQYQEK